MSPDDQLNAASRDVRELMTRHRQAALQASKARTPAAGVISLAQRRAERLATQLIAAGLAYDRLAAQAGIPKRARLPWRLGL